MVVELEGGDGSDSDSGSGCEIDRRENVVEMDSGCSC